MMWVLKNLENNISESSEWDCDFIQNTDSFLFIYII